MTESSLKQRVIIGLGNPGKKYEHTRHNLGYLAVQWFAEKEGWTFREEKQFDAYVAKGVVDTTQVHLLLPTTYMNESGRALRRYLDFFKLSPAHVLVVADDIALEYGEMRLRRMGSPGGHNGLKSIEAHLGTREYVRLRLGIGQNTTEKDLTDYVLDRFSPTEWEELPKLLVRAADVLHRLMRESIAHVMNIVNTKIKQKTRPQVEGQENKHESESKPPL